MNAIYTHFTQVAISYQIIKTKNTKHTVTQIQPTHLQSRHAALEHQNQRLAKSAVNLKSVERRTE